MRRAGYIPLPESRDAPAVFIKLDTHGYEMEILAGAKRSLEQTALLLLEVYNFPIGPGVALFHQMCAHMESMGFRCSDGADMTYRDHDKALWQMDLLFEPVGAEVFKFASAGRRQAGQWSARDWRWARTLPAARAW